MKTCSKCGEIKAAEEFGPRKGRGKGLRSHCRSCEAESGRQRRAANPGGAREYDAKYREENPERRRDWQRSWRAAHPGYGTAWAAANQEAVTASKAKRRTKKTLAGGEFTAQEFRALKQATGNVCLCCGVSGDVVTLAADHVIPVALGGSSAISNIQPLCQSCNSAKHTKSTDYRETNNGAY